MRTLYLLASLASITGCASDSEHHVALSTPEETRLALPLIPTGSDGTPTFTVVSGPARGTLEGAFPTAVYSPAPDFNGTDEIVVRIQDGSDTVRLTLAIDVTPINDPPAAIADVVAGTEDTTQTILAATLLANDRDLDGDALTLTSIGDVRFGTASLVDGNVVYSPKANFTGSSTLRYTVSDGTATTSGVLTIAVGGINDAPIASDDFLSVEENTPLVLESYQLTSNDTDADGQALSITSVTDAQNGTVSLADGVVTFTPSPSFTGDATFHYTISDGAATASALCTVTVSAPQQP